MSTNHSAASGKTLYLLRHAKSSWKNPDLKDIKRPLNKRGKRDAPDMATRFLRRQSPLEAIISSPAKRALSTATVFAEYNNIDIDSNRFIIDEDLYLPSRFLLLRFIQQLDDCLSHIMLVGHNPSFTALTNQLTSSYIDNVPTCGLVTLYFDTDRWESISTGSAELKDFDFPKNQVSG